MTLFWGSAPDQYKGGLSPQGGERVSAKPDFTDCRTARQVDTKMMRYGIEDWCATHPAAGDLLKQLGDAALNSLVAHVLLVMHPKTTSVYDPGGHYDVPFGVMY